MQTGTETREREREMNRNQQEYQLVSDQWNMDVTNVLAQIFTAIYVYLDL